MLALLFGLSALIALIDPILRWYLYQRALEAITYVRAAWKNR